MSGSTPDSHAKENQDHGMVRRSEHPHRCIVTKQKYIIVYVFNITCTVVVQNFLKGVNLKEKVFSCRNLVLVRNLITVDSLLFVGANVCGLIVITLLVPWYNFVGNQFVVLQCKTYHYFVKRLWGQKFVGKSNPGNLQTLIFHKQ